MMKLLLEKLCLAAGVNGVGDVADVIAAELKNYVPQVQRDRLGNVWGVRPAAADNAPVLLLEAHMGEIGFVVTNVTDNGFLRVSACGGVDERILAAQPVTVLTDPPLSGVFCSTPPHIAGANGNMLSAEERGVDIGLSAEKVKETVAVGTRVMFAPHFESLLGDRVCAKALDDRAGCYAMIELIKKDLPVDAYFVFTTMEEIGCIGATVAAYALRPRYGLILEGTTAGDIHTDPNQTAVCRVGEGPVISFMDNGAIYDRGFYRLALEAAAEQNIPVQTKQAVAGGNESSAVQRSFGGCKVLAVSVPCRYIHSPVSVASLQDIENSVRLVQAILNKLL
jgi:endoglucanase